MIVNRLLSFYSVSPYNSTHIYDKNDGYTVLLENLDMLCTIYVPYLRTRERQYT